MGKLDTPDLCAELGGRLQRLKTLCDSLEESQGDPKKYRVVLQRIRTEADALRDTVCNTGAE